MSERHDNILVAVDGSDASLRALRHVALARRVGGLRVTVVNVQPGILPSAFISAAMIEQHQTSNAEEVLGAARGLAADLKLDASFYARKGDAAEQIVSLAAEVGAREIVLGTRGLSRTAGLLLGSVATRVVQLSTLPVTLIK